MEEKTMTDELFSKIVTKALSDRVFLKGLASVPEKTLVSAGFKVTETQLNAIVLARPAEWGGLTLNDIIGRIDPMAPKR